MNWPDIITSIQAAGLSQTQIAKECNCAQATISDLAAGNTKDPRYSIGLALEGLAARAVAGDFKINRPPALTHQAQAATESVAQGVAHA